jgi:hypothetical protein
MAAFAIVEGEVGAVSAVPFLSLSEGFSAAETEVLGRQGASWRVAFGAWINCSARMYFPEC